MGATPRFDSPPSPGLQGKPSTSTPPGTRRQRYVVFRLEAHSTQLSSVRRTIVYARDRLTGQPRHLELLSRRLPDGTEGPPDGEPPPAAAAALRPDSTPTTDLSHRAAA